MEGTFFLDEENYPDMPYGRYLSFHSGKWQLRETAVGRAETPLVDKTSAAGFYNRKTGSNQFAHKTKIKLTDPNGKVIETFGNDTWEVVDTGAMAYVPKNHLDLYWGVDMKGAGGNPASLPNGFRLKGVKVEMVKN